MRMFVSVMTISLICIYSNYLIINNYYNSQLGTTGKMCVFQGRIMKRYQQPLLLLWLTAVVAVNALGSHAAEYDKLVGKVIFFLILVLLSCHSDSLIQLCLCFFRLFIYSYNCPSIHCQSAGKDQQASASDSSQWQQFQCFYTDV